MEDFKKSAQQWTELANQLQTFEDFLKGRFAKPPRVFFANSDEFKTESPKLVEAIRNFQNDLPLGSMEDLGWPKRPRILKYHEGDPSALQDLVNSSHSAPTQAPIYATPAAFTQALKGFQNQINEQKKKFAETLKLDPAKFSLLELESLVEVQKIDPNVAANYAVGIQENNPKSRLFLFTMIDKQLGQEQIIRAVYGNNWLEEAKEKAAAPKPEEGVTGPFPASDVPPDYILRNEYSEKAAQAIKLLFEVENGKRSFGAMNPITGMGNAPNVKWAQDQIRTKVDELVKLEVISDKDDPKLGMLLAAVIPNLQPRRRTRERARPLPYPARRPDGHRPREPAVAAAVTHRTAHGRADGVPAAQHDVWPRS